VRSYTPTLSFLTHSREVPPSSPAHPGQAPVPTAPAPDLPLAWSLPSCGPQPSPRRRTRGSVLSQRPRTQECPSRVAGLSSQARHRACRLWMTSCRSSYTLMLSGFITSATARRFYWESSGRCAGHVIRSRSASPSVATTNPPEDRPSTIRSSAEAPAMPGFYGSSKPLKTDTLARNCRVAQRYAILRAAREGRMDRACGHANGGEPCRRTSR